MTPLLVAALGLAAVGCLGRARRLTGAALTGATPTGAALAGVAPGPGRVATWSHRLGARWSGALADAGVEADPAASGRVALGGLATVVLAAAARGGAVGAGVAGAVTIVGALVARHATRGRGARAADARLPELVEHVARGLRGGHDLRGAALAAGEVVGGPHGEALLEVVARLDGGAGWDLALDGWHDAHPRRPVLLVVGALAVAEASGGRAGPALDGVAATLRARGAVTDEARALASQARASAAVLVGLPVVVAVGGAAADRRVADALLGTPWGLGCIAVAVVLDGVGALWMQRVVADGAP